MRHLKGIERALTAEVKIEKTSRLKKIKRLGGRPGQVVIGDDSCLRGRGFESWHSIPTGWTFFKVDLLFKLYFFEK